MAVHRDVSSLVRAQEARLLRVVEAAEESARASVEMAQKEAEALTNGPATTSHTPGRGKGFRARRGLPVGRGTGELSRSWRWVKVRDGVYRLVNVAKHAPFALAGRGFQQELRRRTASKAREIHQQALQQALKG